MYIDFWQKLGLKEAHFNPTQDEPCSVDNLTIVKDQVVNFCEKRPKTV